jgi:hypothetical protein
MASQILDARAIRRATLRLWRSVFAFARRTDRASLAASDSD